MSPRPHLMQLRRRGRRTAVAAAVAVALAAGGCGLEADRQPEQLAAEDVPFDLLAPLPSTSTTSTTAPEVVTREVSIFLAGPDGKLVAVPRTMPVPVTVGDIVKQLLDGATDDEAAKGLRSVITSGTRLLGTTRRPDGTVTIDFSEEFAIPQGEDGITAVAQVVFTATEIEGVTGVTFALEGEPKEVPRGDGTLTSGPLTRASYPQRQPAAPPLPPAEPPPDGAPPAAGAGAG